MSRQRIKLDDPFLQNLVGSGALVNNAIDFFFNSTDGPLPKITWNPTKRSWNVPTESKGADGIRQVFAAAPSVARTTSLS